MQRSEERTFLDRVRRTVRRHALFAPGDRVLAALSGGPDSVALVSALAALADEFGVTLRAAHANHALRGAESQRDQDLAEAVAARLGISCAVGAAALAPGSANLEERAREARYAFLADCARASACTRIATGHTLDDQAETVLVRLLRGAGPDGLGAIRPLRPLGNALVVRPLLDCPRALVLAYLRARDLPYAEDSSNRERRFLRNRIRHDILPGFRELNPSAAQALAAAARLWAQESEFLDDLAAARLVLLPDGALAVAAIAAAPAALRARLVRAWLRRRRGDLRRLGGAHFEAVVELALGPRPSGRVALPGSRRVVREYDRLFLDDTQPALRSPPPGTHRLAAGDSVLLESGWRFSAVIETTEEDAVPAPPSDPWVLSADAAELGSALVVRAVRPGDRIQPFGMRGHRKLQDVFVDCKLPAARRWERPVVEADGEILWVPGLVRSGRAPVTAATRAAWRVHASAPRPR